MTKNLLWRKCWRMQTKAEISAFSIFSRIWSTLLRGEHASARCKRPVARRWSLHSRERRCQLHLQAGRERPVWWVHHCKALEEVAKKTGHKRAQPFNTPVSEAKSKRGGSSSKASGTAPVADADPLADLMR